MPRRWKIFVNSWRPGGTANTKMLQRCGTILRSLLCTSITYRSCFSFLSYCKIFQLFLQSFKLNFLVPSNPPMSRYLIEICFQVSFQTEPQQRIIVVVITVQYIFIYQVAQGTAKNHFRSSSHAAPAHMSATRDGGVTLSLVG